MPRHPWPPQSHNNALFTTTPRPRNTGERHAHEWQQHVQKQTKSSGYQYLYFCPCGAQQQVQEIALFPVEECEIPF